MRIHTSGEFKLTGAMVLNGLIALNVDFSYSDKEAVMRCCFHDDSGRRPHLYVNIKDKPGVAHCFFCHATADFVNVVAAITGWNHTKSRVFVTRLPKMVELDVPEVDESPKTEDPLAPYAYRHPYLTEDRGLSEAIQQRFDIGYDKERQAIVFPWFDRNGKLVAIKKRRVLEKGFDYEKGAKTSHTLFGLHLVKRYGVCWLTEGEIDAMTLDQVFRIAHYDNHFALALGGSSMKSSQAEALATVDPKAVILMLDSDQAGRAAQAEVRKVLLETAFAGSRIIEAEYPPDVKDANEMKYEQIIQLTNHINEVLNHARI